MLCDGRLVCGCADPYGKRVLGDARKTSVSDVWTGSTVTTLRADLNPLGVPEYEAAAKSGVGVFETLKGLSRLVLTRLATSV